MPAPEAETIAVIGAGKVGRELARRAAVAGFHVVLEDLIPTSLECARQEIRHTLDDAVSSGSLDQAQADEAFARIDCATSIEDAARRATLSWRPARTSRNPSWRCSACSTASACPIRSS